MIIKRFQNGGGFATFTPIIKTAPQLPATQASSKTESKAASSLLDDKLYAELLKGGLTNDVNALVSQLIELEGSSELPFTNVNTRTASLRLIGKVNEIKQNKALWENAVAKADKSGGLDEVAVGTSGEVYIKDNKNKIKAISLQDYSENRESMKLLSVAELMNERNHNSQLTGQNNIFNVANNSVGLSKITEHIKGLISAFGNETIADTKTYSKNQILTELGKFAGKKPTAEEAEGVKKLMEIANTPGELYKVETQNSSERRQAMRGAKYIWETLGDAAQKKLTAAAVISGRKDPTSYILDMISTNTDTSTKSEITPAKMPGESNGDGEDGFKNKPITPFELLHNGKTGKKIFNWNDPATGKTFNLVSTGINKLTNIDGKPLGMATLKNVVNSEIGLLVKSNDIFFGDKKVSLNDLQNIIYDGNDAARVYMPVNSQGAPDYNKLKEVKRLEEEIFKNNNLTPEEINKIFENHGLSYVKVDQDKNYIMNDKFKPFLIMYGLTGEEANAVKENSNIKALSSSEEDGIVDAMNNVWDSEKIKNKPVGWTNWTTTYYSGMIAIPYKEDSSMYTASASKNLLAPQVTLDYARQNAALQTAAKLNANPNLIF